MKRKKVLNFRLPDNNGNIFDLFENLDSNILLVFYPKDNTPVCSNQLKDYSDNLELFQKHSIKVVAVNNGTPQDHSFFCSKKDLQIPILSDSQLEVARQFSALYPFNFLKRKLVFISSAAEVIFEKTLPPYKFWNSEEILGFFAKNEFI
jgi:thioredoxin-dependent peroxiredoxin